MARGKERGGKFQIYRHPTGPQAEMREASAKTSNNIGIRLTLIRQHHEILSDSPGTVSSFGWSVSRAHARAPMMQALHVASDSDLCDMKGG